MSLSVPLRRPSGCITITTARDLVSKTKTKFPKRHTRCPNGLEGVSRHEWLRKPSLTRVVDQWVEAKSLEDVFFQSLAIAGTCSRHHTVPSVNARELIGVQRTGRYAKKVSSQLTRRRFSTARWQHQEIAAAVVTTREHTNASSTVSNREFQDLVDIYDTSPSSLSDQLRPMKAHLRLAPRLLMTAQEEEEQRGRKIYSTWLAPPLDDEHATQLNRFKRALSLPLGQTNLDRLWSSYQNLPTPQPRYLNNSNIRRLFRQLSWAPAHGSASIESRYFQLLQECMAEKVSITRAEWNTAIAYAGRRGRIPTTQEVQHAAEIWSQMEQSGTTANATTFGILFDSAVKAGCFALADTIYNEVLHRELDLDRYFRTSLIYYAGVRADGDAVRQAFREFVDAGELVDTVVMNCVIASLIRTGEPAAAEQVFAKMKRLYAEKMGSAAINGWKNRRQTGRRLQSKANQLKAENLAHERSFFGAVFAMDDQRETAQNDTPIAPDSKTYRLLIQHHALTAGDLGAVLSLLAEMKSTGQRVSGAAYVAIFRSFGKYGGIFHTEWNEANLERIWKDFVLDITPTKGFVPLRRPHSELLRIERRTITDRDQERPPYFTAATALQILRAFNTCVGVDRMQEAWIQIRSLWRKLPDHDRDELQAYVDKFVQKRLDHVDFQA